MAPQKVNVELPYDLAMSLLHIYLKELNKGTHVLVAQCSLQYYSQEPMGENNLSVHHKWSRKTKCGTYIE